MAGRRDITSFDDFVESQQMTDDDRRYYARELEEWRALIVQFYKQIKTYLTRYTRDGKISLDSEQIEIYEEDIGNYVVDNILVKIGRTTVVIQPIATLLIGSKGRIDMSGPNGIIRFLLIDRGVTDGSSLVRVTINKAGSTQNRGEISRRDRDWTWKIIDQSRTPVVFNELNEESFLGALMSVARA